MLRLLYIIDSEYTISKMGHLRLELQMFLQRLMHMMHNSEWPLINIWSVMSTETMLFNDFIG